jgi:polyferredoxin
MPTLRERKLDLVPLAALFLERASGDRPGRRLSAAAERELAARSFSRKNAAELRKAMELASILAQGEEIRADELFTGPKDEPAPFLLDVTDRPGVKGLVTGRVLGAVRWMSAAFFIGVTALFLFAPRTTASRALNAVTWGLWEPALIASFLLVGRFWCTFCPLSAMARLAQRAAGRGWAFPEFLSGRGVSVSLASAGFVSIVWAERAFRMPEEPAAAGVFFVVLGLLAVGVALLYDREVFCRRLCPLGTLGAACSLPAPFQLRSTPSVCGSLCRTHDCFRGNASEAGCPVAHHPLYLAEGYACKACFQCVKSCPHGSVRFGFRWPLEGVWRLGGEAGELIPFAATLFTTAVALFAAHHLRIEGAGWAALSLSALALGLGAGRWLARPSGDGEGTARTGRLTFSLLVLGWALLLSSEVANWPGAAALRIEPVGIPVLGLVQGAIVLFGLLLTAICLGNLRTAEK